MTVGRPITAGRSRDRCVSNVVSNPISDAARAPSPLYRARGQRRPSAASGLPIRNDFGTLSRVDRFQHGESQFKHFPERRSIGHQTCPRAGGHSHHSRSGRFSTMMRSDLNYSIAALMRLPPLPPGYRTVQVWSDTPRPQGHQTLRSILPTILLMIATLSVEYSWQEKR